MTEITLDVNGKKFTKTVPDNTLLSTFLREHLNLTGTHVGCEHGICGACTVLMNGDSVRACLTLAVQADGAEVETVESLGDSENLGSLQRAFREHHALQCGFCTPGMLMTATDMLRKYALETEDEIRVGLSGNICRCTGYQHIVDAISAARDERNKK